MLGRLDLGRADQALAMGYYSGLARLRAATVACTAQHLAHGNMQLEVRPSPEHMFTLCAKVCRDVLAGTPVSLCG